MKNSVFLFQGDMLISADRYKSHFCGCKYMPEMVYYIPECKHIRLLLEIIIWERGFLWYR